MAAQAEEALQSALKSYADVFVVVGDAGRRPSSGGRGVQVSCRTQAALKRRSLGQCDYGNRAAL